MKCHPVWLWSTIGTVIFATSLVAPVVHADAKRGSSAKVEEPYDPAVPLRPGFHVEKRLKAGLMIASVPLLGLGAAMLIQARKAEYLQSVAYTFGGLATALGTVLLLAGLSSPRFVVVPGEPAKGEPLIPDGAPTSALRWRNNPPDVGYANGLKAPEARLSFGLDSVGTGTGLTFSGAF